MSFFAVRNMVCFIINVRGIVETDYRTGFL